MAGLQLDITKNNQTDFKADQGVWSGLPIATARSYYDELYALGTLSPIHFGIILQPYDGSGPLADIELFNTEKYKIPWLCQSIDLSLLDAQTDSVQVGTFQLNHITGNSSGEISIPFIETRNAVILNSALAVKAVMFPDGEQGGTQAVPSDYLMRMTIYIYDKHSYSTQVFYVEHLVALQTGSIPLDATNRNGVGIVTLNFIKMFPMLK